MGQRPSSRRFPPTSFSTTSAKSFSQITCSTGEISSPALRAFRRSLFSKSRTLSLARLCCHSSSWCTRLAASSSASACSSRGSISLICSTCPVSAMLTFCWRYVTTIFCLRATSVLAICIRRSASVSESCISCFCLCSFSFCTFSSFCWFWLKADLIVSVTLMSQASSSILTSTPLATWYGLAPASSGVRGSPPARRISCTAGAWPALAALHSGVLMLRPRRFGLAPLPSRICTQPAAPPAAASLSNVVP
mmetsp:Transcript_88455/g.228090  ORF Transcript_88455/g.228090 Transcript_88455/m.228090 type:complete len:250 (+) Transcript_88455:519-1268(+)